MIEAGVDEAGRGPLAGPVFSAAVILDKEKQNWGLNDSKKISETKRESIAQEIKEKAIAWSIGISSSEEIDEVNILKATLIAMKRAIEGYFSVNVEDVNIIKVKGKTKRSRYRIRKKSDWKKAYVRLADGQSIEVTSE